MDVRQRAELSPAWVTRAEGATEPDPWILGFGIYQRESGALVGGCGFKGPPGPDGIVEIAYGIAPSHQGKGYATEVAEALVAFAFLNASVRLVCAHTREKANASARVLAKCGFRSVGTVVDPEDGPVWRWERFFIS